MQGSICLSRDLHANSPNSQAAGTLQVEATGKERARLQKSPWCASHPGGPTVLQDGLPLSAVDLLAADEVAGGVSKVDEASLGMEVQGSGVHEVLNGNHVFVWDLGTHIHAPDDARPALAIHEEQLMLWL